MSSVVNITVRDEDIGLTLSELHGNTRNAVLFAAGRRLPGEIIRQNAVPFRSGSLLDSMQVSTSSEGVNVRFTAPHAEAVEFGARPHKIVAKNWPTLVFFKSGWKRPKEVNHPGFSGRGYALKVGKLLEELIIEELFARLSRGLL